MNVENIEGKVFAVVLKPVLMKEDKLWPLVVEVFEHVLDKEASQIKRTHVHTTLDQNLESSHANFVAFTEEVI